MFCVIATPPPRCSHGPSSNPSMGAVSSRTSVWPSLFAFSVQCGIISFSVAPVPAADLQAFLHAQKVNITHSGAHSTMLDMHARGLKEVFKQGRAGQGRAGQGTRDVFRTWRATMRRRSNGLLFACFVASARA